MKKRSLFNRRASGFSIEMATDDEAKMYMYDEIGFWGINSKDFITALNDISARNIHLHINSPGGDVFEGIAIANAIRAHDSRVTVHVDALAASIASIIAIAGDYVRMADNAFLMIHQPFMVAIGNSAELRKGAGLLDQVAGSLIGDYVKRTGQTSAQVTKWMDEETWFSATEAKEKGFIDAIDNASKDAPIDAFDLSIFSKTPSPLLAREPQEPTIRETETALRDAGYSRAEANRIASVGIAALKRTPRDAEAAPRDEAAQRELARMLEGLTNTLK